MCFETWRSVHILVMADHVNLVSLDDSSSSDTVMDACDGSSVEQAPSNATGNRSAEDISAGGLIVRRAEMYQEYMKQIPVPLHRGSTIPYNSWTQLGASIKELYEQPLHYLTNILLKQWDQLRFEMEDEYKPLDTIIHPVKAEAAIWLVEEVHRRTASHHHIAKLWLQDPMYHAFIDSKFPKI